MAYQKKYNRPYTQYEDLPAKTTPITAAIKNNEADTFEKIEAWLYAYPLDSMSGALTGLSQAFGNLQNNVYTKSETNSEIDSRISSNNANYDTSSVVNQKLDAAKEEVYENVPGENIMCWPYSGVVTGGNPYTTNGCTFTVNDDGSITLTTVEGGATANTTYTISNRAYITRPHVNPVFGKTYTLSGCPEGGATSGTYRVSASYTKNGSAVSYGNDLGNGLTFTVSEPLDVDTALGIVITVYRGFKSTQGVTFYPMLEEGSIRHGYLPTFLSRQYISEHSGSGGGDYHIYSTEEHVVGQWIDGSPVYEKTIVGTLTNRNADTVFNIGENVSFVVDVNVMINNGVSFTHFPTTAQNYSDLGFVYTLVDDNTVHIFCTHSAWIGRQTIITIRYTKTGSSAATLSETPKAVAAAMEDPDGNYYEDGMPLVAKSAISDMSEDFVDEEITLEKSSEQVKL